MEKSSGYLDKYLESQQEPALNLHSDLGLATQEKVEDNGREVEAKIGALDIKYDYKPLVYDFKKIKEEKLSNGESVVAACWDGMMSEIVENGVIPMGLERVTILEIDDLQISAQVGDKEQQLSISDLLPTGTKIYASTDQYFANDSSHVVPNPTKDGFSIFVSGSLTHAVDVVTLLHEIGHMYAATKSEASEGYGAYEALHDRSNQTFSSDKNLSYCLNIERKAWAYALKRLAPFMSKDGNDGLLSRAGVSKLIHRAALRSYSDKIRLIRDLHPVGAANNQIPTDNNEQKVVAKEKSAEAQMVEDIDSAIMSVQDASLSDLLTILELIADYPVGEIKALVLKQQTDGGEIKMSKQSETITMAEKINSLVLEMTNMTEPPKYSKEGGVAVRTPEFNQYREQLLSKQQEIVLLLQTIKEQIRN